tara:strand:+ start:537 stop:1532 length:996 start_codon:yes stop_codon:yes gene_type:complete
MADFTAPPRGEAYAFEPGSAGQPEPTSNALTNFANVAGALVSLALIVGIGVWGYKLLARDVTGIPVVKAIGGEMRVRPDDPGGQRARNQGLSVNNVAADGSAARPADRLRLAPEPIELTEQDHLVQATTIEQPQPLRPGVDEARHDLPDVAAALQSGNVVDLVAQLTAGVEPLSGLDNDQPGVAPTLSESIVAEVATAQVQVAAVLDAPGLRRSIRPRKRPAVFAPVTPASLGTPARTTEEVDPGSLPAGTRLAQLGAFDSPEVAREQWDMIQQRFSTYMDDKKRIVQKAKSGGRVFYRLRAMGFADIAEARRFCSALVAENADCIPVVTR